MLIRNLLLIRDLVLIRNLVLIVFLMVLIPIDAGQRISQSVKIRMHQQ